VEKFGSVSRGKASKGKRSVSRKERIKLHKFNKVIDSNKVKVG